MQKIIDVYITRKFLATFFYSSILIITIAILFDITEKVDSFVDDQVPILEIIFDYYIYFAAWIWLLLAPLFVFLTVIYFTSRLAHNQELVSMLAGRISMHRILRPYIISAIFLMLIFLVFQHYF
jgi:lipopolysaccharide export system permease protein